MKTRLYPNTQGSKDAIRLAFKREFIDNGEDRMNMIKSRTLTPHTYNEDLADEIVSAILNSYYQEFMELQKKLGALAEKESLQTMNYGLKEQTIAQINSVFCPLS